MSENKTILIVDDEAAIRDMLRVALEMADYHCLEAADTQTAHTLIIDQKPSLILLDWMLPGTSGIDLARRLKKDEFTANIPIIMLTAKGEEDNKIQGLEVGADDYITKPFSPRELVARLKAVLRRTEGIAAADPIEVEGLKMDPVSHVVTIDNAPLQMGPTEYRLLEFFLAVGSCLIMYGEAMCMSKNALLTCIFVGYVRLLFITIGLFKQCAAPDIASLPN
jgi:two-component system phosphate regulon response regulator PhoB